MRAVAIAVVARSVAVAVVLASVALGGERSAPPPAPAAPGCILRCGCAAPHVLLCVERELGAASSCTDACACDDDARLLCMVGP